MKEDDKIDEANEADQDLEAPDVENDVAEGVNDPDDEEPEESN